MSGGADSVHAGAERKARMGSMDLCFLELRQESDARIGDRQAAAMKAGMHL